MINCNPTPIISQFNNQQFDSIINVAADKSISHRALIFASIANGRSKIYNLLEGEDVICTANALKSMGVEITKHHNNNQEEGYYEVNGVGVSGLKEPSQVLEMGNSGTSTRLLAGLVSPYGFTSFFNGDASLSKRPMSRIFKPLQLFGAKITARQNNLLPFAISGTAESLPINFTLENASAQVKSCILLSALATRGRTTIIEPELSRDHTEIIMQHLGCDIAIDNLLIDGKNTRRIQCTGLNSIKANNFIVPGDISSASFFIVLTIISKNSQLTIKNIGLNKLRTGIITTLLEMGARIRIENQQLQAGEIVGDIIVESSNLQGVEVPANRAATMIDEYPILAIASANASGTTIMRGLSELKIKESNRLASTCNNLIKCGVEAKIENDDLIVKGGINQPKTLTTIETAMDHRMAMSFLILGTKLNQGLIIDDSSMIATSFPCFLATSQKLNLGFKTDNNNFAAI
jgi:3-phosphoshikimate 1-carboxyvinyltransferase